MISFESQCRFNLKGRLAKKQWIKLLVSHHHKTLGDISYVFYDDEQLLEINKQYLQHDFYTDIITFDYSQDDTISGDIAISIDRVKDNAKDLGTDWNDELDRVLIHGILHLIGFKDKTPKDAKIMREQEDFALSLREQSK